MIDDDDGFHSGGFGFAWDLGVLDGNAEEKGLSRSVPFVYTEEVKWVTLGLWTPEMIPAREGGLRRLLKSMGVILTDRKR